MTSYNAIYGSFAALPLFLLWMQISWEILLLGGELSFAYQNVARFDEERESLLVSYDCRRKLMVGVSFWSRAPSATGAAPSPSRRYATVWMCRRVS